MTYIHRTLIVPANLAPTVRKMCEQLAGPPGAGMFTTGLSPTGSAPATHFISSGMIEDTFGSTLASPDAMFDACEAAGMTTTLEVCSSILSACIVSSAEPLDEIARTGLTLVEIPPS